MTKYAAFSVNAAYFLFRGESESCFEIPPAYTLPLRSAAAQK